MDAGIMKESAAAISEEDRLMSSLLRFIRDNGLKAGDKLPSIRTLSDSFSCTQSQRRGVILRAEALGFVMVQPRSGCYVRNTSLDSMLQTFCLLFETTMADDLSLVEIYDLKTALETAITKQVALIRTEGELLALRNIIVQEEAAADKDEMIKLDENFHMYLASISRNRFFLAVISVIQSMLRTARHSFADYVESYSQIINDHKNIYEAIKEKDSDSAYELASIHANRRKAKLLSCC